MYTEPTLSIKSNSYFLQVTQQISCRDKIHKESKTKLDKNFIYSPTDALVSCLKKILKFTLKHLFNVNFNVNLILFF